ncbi:MAG: hypothetical protein JST00_47380 [Deltaproteobacteria bacterium]|nr:hypothetical protein [Deltaproteobacteria bacterium]
MKLAIFAWSVVGMGVLAGCPGKDDAKGDAAATPSAAATGATPATAATPAAAADPAGSGSRATEGAGAQAAPGTAGKVVAPGVVVAPNGAATIANGAKQVAATGSSLVLQNDAGVGSIKQGPSGTTITGKDGKTITLPGNVPGLPR